MTTSMPTHAPDPAPAGRRGQIGPPLLPPALAFTGLSVACPVLGVAGPRPTSTPAEVAARLIGNSGTATATVTDRAPVRS